jgi:hypothetical protein
MLGTIAPGCDNVSGVWRVVYRSWGIDEEEWHGFDDAQAALEFAIGLRDSDRDHLLEYLTLERWDGERWVPAE